MVDKYEVTPDEYPLPVVRGEALIAVMDAYTKDDDGVSERVEIDAEAAFEFMAAHNFGIVDAIDGTLRTAGYGADTIGVTKLSMALTHALLHAQARIDRGLPGIDPSSDEYFLPVVTQDAALAYFTGEVAAAQALGINPYDELQQRNEFIPFVVRNCTELPIGSGPAGGRASYAAEFAAIATHGLLREQATMDAFGQGGSPVS